MRCQLGFHSYINVALQGESQYREFLRSAPLKIEIYGHTDLPTHGPPKITTSQCRHLPAQGHLNTAMSQLMDLMTQVLPNTGTF